MAKGWREGKPSSRNSECTGREVRKDKAFMTKSLAAR